MVAILLNDPPVNDVQLTWGKSDSTFRIEEIRLEPLYEGQIRVKLLYLSNDPTQRGWISANQNPARTYVPPIYKDEVIRSMGVGEVIESKSSKYAKGVKVVGLMGWADELVISEQAVFEQLDPALSPELYLSSLGMTGLTAYFGLKEVAQLKEGQTILISAASGATGSMAVQLAKHMFKAFRVIGIAGSDEKVEWVKSLGADYCANYKEPGYKKKLSEYIGGDFVDVYFDNVGGEILDFALTHTKRFGLIVACGAISGYNDLSKLAVRAWPEIVTNRLTVRGFIVFDYADRFAEGITAIGDAMKKGQVKGTDAVSVVDVLGDWRKVPETWFKLFTEQKPKGKLVTKL